MFRFTTSTGLVPPDPNYPHSLRTTRASWAGKGRDKKQKAEEKSDQVDLRVNGSRIILFSLGGLTYSELRSVYEVSRDSQREIYIGNCKNTQIMINRLHVCLQSSSIYRCIEKFAYNRSAATSYITNCCGIAKRGEKRWTFWKEKINFCSIHYIFKKVLKSP